MQTTGEKVIEILKLTNDGDDLSSNDLNFVQNCLNYDMGERGEIYLMELLSNCRDGYKKPWHLGIEHMTKDHEGYIYYKGKQVEHYSFYDDDEERSREKAALIILKARCEMMEKSGFEISTLTVVWKWHWYLEQMDDELRKPYFELCEQYDEIP